MTQQVTPRPALKQWNVSGCCHAFSAVSGVTGGAGGESMRSSTGAGIVAGGVERPVG